MTSSLRTVTGCSSLEERIEKLSRAHGIKLVTPNSVKREESSSDVEIYIHCVQYCESLAVNEVISSHLPSKESNPILFGLKSKELGWGRGFQEANDVMEHLRGLLAVLQSGDPITDDLCGPCRFGYVY